jgi:magnesium transporter
LRAFYAGDDALAFTLRCYVESAALPGETAFGSRPLDVRIVVTGDYLLTLHSERLSLPAALARELPEGRSGRYVVYAVLDALVESVFDALGEVELRLEELGASWAQDRGARVARAAVRAGGARLASMRRSVTAEQVVFERLGVEIGALRGFDSGDASDFDRLSEQVDRLQTSIDAAADGLGMLLDLQLNERAYLVSVVATIFVPLTFVTGFFGMNFGWLVERIDGPWAFWLLGMILPLAAAAALAWRVVRRWLVDEGSRGRRS